MSYVADETYDVYQELKPKARKAHKCDACKETIPAGARYTRVSIIFDGAASSVKRCYRCQCIHEHLRSMGRKFDAWPDEKLNCGLKYEDEWGPMSEYAQMLAFLPVSLTTQQEGSR